METKKTFDTVKMVRRIRDAHYEQLKDRLEKKYPGDPLPPFADDDTGNDRQQ